MAVVVSLPAGVQEARRTRESLGLGASAPIHDLLALVEEGGNVAVTLLPLPEGVAGAYGQRDGRPFIFVNSRDPAVRRRFTLAHEFGHYALRHVGMVDRQQDIYGRSGSPRERSANAFAAEFLMPLAGVAWWMETHGNPIVDLEIVVRLAAYYRVSAETARYRLQSARFLPQQADRERLDAAISAGDHLVLQRKLRMESPPDSIDAIDRNATRIPAAMRRNGILGYEFGLLDVERIAQAFHETPGSVAREFEELGVSRLADEPLF